MGDHQGDTLYAGTPVFYESGPYRGGRFVTAGKVLDPRFLGPLHPRVLVCDIPFRLQGRYYLGNPRGEGERRRSVLLHRVVYTAVYGEIPPDHEVHHIDDNPYNNHPDNLGAILRF